MLFESTIYGRLLSPQPPLESRAEKVALPKGD